MPAGRELLGAGDGDCSRDVTATGTCTLPELRWLRWLAAGLRLALAESAWMVAGPYLNACWASRKFSGAPRVPIEANLAASKKLSGEGRAALSEADPAPLTNGETDLVAVGDAPFLGVMLKMPSPWTMRWGGGVCVRTVP